MSDEGTRINTNEEQHQESGGTDDGGSGTINKPKRPFGWDARDFEKNVWLPKSPESIKGRYTGRFWEEE